jgi:hypothetical protein
MKTITEVVIPAKAGIQFNIWMPAFAGMTTFSFAFPSHTKSI